MTGRVCRESDEVMILGWTSVPSVRARSSQIHSSVVRFEMTWCVRVVKLGNVKAVVVVRRFWWRSLWM